MDNPYADYTAVELKAFLVSHKLADHHYRLAEGANHRGSRSRNVIEPV
jgi:hypothetical protein